MISSEPAFDSYASARGDDLYIPYRTENFKIVRLHGRSVKTSCGAEARDDAGAGLTERVPPEFRAVVVGLALGGAPIEEHGAGGAREDRDTQRGAAGSSSCARSSLASSLSAA